MYQLNSLGAIKLCYPESIYALDPMSSNRRSDLKKTILQREFLDVSLQSLNCRGYYVFSPECASALLMFRPVDKSENSFTSLISPKNRYLRVAGISTGRNIDSVHA